jgi:hypothetical protein
VTRVLSRQRALFDLRRLIALPASASLLTLAGCASLLEWVDPPKSPTPTLPASSEILLERSPIEGLGLGSLEPLDAIVRVVAGDIACTGTLIAADRVLTAHHCVAMRSDLGEIEPRDLPPGRIRVEVGSDYLPWAEVGVRAVVAPECGYATGVGDISILILEQPLEGVPTLPLRFDAVPAPSEAAQPIGFGHCALSPEGIRRRVRLGGTITKVGEQSFEIEASICPGDSGGPVLDAGGEVLGVISASAMDASETTRERTELTRVDAWRELFAIAREVARGVSVSELPPAAGCPDG